MGGRDLSGPENPSGRWSAWIKAALALVLFGAGGFLAWRTNMPLSDLDAAGRGIGPGWGWAVFVLAYSAISVFPVPGRDVAKIVCAELFGYTSILLVWLGEIVAAIVAYWIARTGGHDLVRLLLGARAERVDRTLQRANGWKIFWLRVIPLTPYRYFNLAAGLLRLPVRPYLLGSVPGMLVRTALFQIAFVLAGDALKTRGVTTWQVFIFSTVLVPAMLGVWWWLRAGKRTPDSSGRLTRS